MYSFFFCIPAYQYATNSLFNLDGALKFTVGSYGAVLAFVIGSLFSSLKIRTYRNGKTHKIINDNIKSQLIKYGLTAKQDEKKIEEVKSSKLLMHIFYHFIDNDESLKEKSKVVRDNGLFWSSTADVAILGCFFSWLYLILILVIGPEPLFVVAGLMIGLIGLFSGAVLHPISVKEHINLGNEQIEFIVANYKKELQDKINGLFT